VLPADLADPGALAQLIPRLRKALGPPTCLINNASVFLEDHAATLDLASWDAHIDVNLRAPVFLAKSFAEHLPADATGNIISLLDQRVLRPAPEFFSYAVSKAALWAATRMLAQAFAPRIRVNGIGPGPVLRNSLQSEDDFAAECRATLLGRAVGPDEIATAVRFILDAPSMTGQMIALDGGQHLA
jgi:NAD(P)-dependent dehydrogenase (short-subunit alcohol dehydrogenase family)